MSTGTGMCAARGYVYVCPFVAGGPSELADRRVGRAERGGLFRVKTTAVMLVRWT
jgi:hypothetical protein